MYEWNWHAIYAYRMVFLEGALETLWLTLLAIILGSAFGFILMFGRRSTNAVLSGAARIYIEIFRSLPILVLLIWIYYVVPMLFNWRMSAFSAGLIGLSVNLSAFVAETLRASIESIPRGQYESGVALGMSNLQIMQKIILPQSMKGALPNLISLYAQQLKNSSLASVIGVNELLHRSNTLISNIFRPLEIYTTIAIVYVLLILPFIIFATRIERGLRQNVRQL